MCSAADVDLFLQVTVTSHLHPVLGPRVLRKEQKGMPKNKINCEYIVIPLAFLYYFLLTKRNDNIFRSYIHVDNETVNVRK